jgi:hypothetical protein
MNRKYFWPLLIACTLALMTLTFAGEGEKVDPNVPEKTPPEKMAPSPFVYLLETDGQPLGEFAGCAGLGSSNEVEQQTVVTANGLTVTKNVCGALLWAPIRLKSKGPGDAKVWHWRKTVENAGANASLRTGHITMFAAGSAEPLATWSFQRAWPARLVCSEGQLELVIVHEGLSLGGTEGTKPAGRTR